MELQKGQKCKLTDLTEDGRLRLSVAVSLPAGEADVTCFGVDGAGKLSDDRYFVFYNQTRSPEGAVSMEQSGGTTAFSIDLGRLPDFLQRLVVTIAVEDGTMQALARGTLLLEGGLGQASYAFSGGFNGGLSALLAHFGGEEARPDTPAPSPAPAPAPAPAEPRVNLTKISLKKSGESHKIDLKKNRQRIHVNLNWDQRQGLFSRGIDLDLACMYRLKDGRQGVIQALGNSFGASDQPPYIRLDKDDRSGASVNGENMDFFRPELIDFAIVFAFIYEGVPNWRATNARVVLSQQGEPDIEVHIDNPNSNERFCVLASLTGRDGGLEVRREDLFFNSHRAVDAHYHFGFRWVAGRK